MRGGKMLSGKDVLVSHDLAVFFEGFLQAYLSAERQSKGRKPL
jgi:hypothetical protein